jgi:hypothetical protein
MENLRDISSGKQKHCKFITIQSNVKKVRIGCISKTEEIHVNAYLFRCHSTYTIIIMMIMMIIIIITIIIIIVVEKPT